MPLKGKSLEFLGGIVLFYGAGLDGDSGVTFLPVLGFGGHCAGDVAGGEGDC